MTVSETSGEIGLIVGRIGIGAAFEGRPLVQVARLLAAGRGLTFGLAAGCGGGTGAGGGVGCTTGVCCGTAGTLISRWIRDFRNQLDVLVVNDGIDSGASLKESVLLLTLDCFRLLSNREEDFGRRGSKASLKYSCERAWVEVGLFLGSHIRHQVTKSLRLAGHCGGLSMVSRACGAI